MADRAEWRPTRLELAEAHEDKVIVYALDKDTGELVTEIEIHAHRTKIESHESIGLVLRTWRS